MKISEYIEEQSKMYLRDRGSTREEDREQAVIGRYLRDSLLPQVKKMENEGSKI